MLLSKTKKRHTQSKKNDIRNDWGNDWGNAWGNDWGNDFCMSNHWFCVCYIHAYGPIGGTLDGTIDGTIRGTILSVCQKRLPKPWFRMIWRCSFKLANHILNFDIAFMLFWPKSIAPTSIGDILFLQCKTLTYQKIIQIIQRWTIFIHLICVVLWENIFDWLKGFCCTL